MQKVLEDIFQRKRTFTKLHLKINLLSLKFNETEKLEDHFLKFDSFIREFDEAGYKREVSDEVCNLLLTMTENYQPVITAIETVDTNTAMEFVKGRLLDAELKKNKRNALNKDEVAFKSNTLICFKCNKPGRKAYECRSKKLRRRTI